MGNHRSCLRRGCLHRVVRQFYMEDDLEDARSAVPTDQTRASASGTGRQSHLQSPVSHAVLDSAKDIRGDFIEICVAGALGPEKPSLRFHADERATGNELKKRVAALASMPISEVRLLYRDAELGTGELREDAAVARALATRVLALSLTRVSVREVAASSPDALVCAICFEDLAFIGGAASLPCNCHIDYCSRCWDRALNAKYDQVQRAECPSCRTALRVDFDPVRRCLTFKRQDFRCEKDMQIALESDRKMRDRLYEQARPLQKKLLDNYGLGLELGGLVVPLEPWPGPKCVCGSHLACVSVHDRVFAFIARQASLTPEAAKLDERCIRIVDMYLSGKRKVPITCDICNATPLASETVWTCEAGPTTLLHGLAYDVCGSCYAQHVFGGSDIDTDVGSASAGSMAVHLALLSG